MTVTIDRAGRIILSKEFRQRLGLSPTQSWRFVDHPDGLLLRIPESRLPLVEINGLLVHQGRLEEGVDLDCVLESVREERIQDVIRG